jgi:ketosteroid isomerase-like protein
MASSSTAGVLVVLGAAMIWHQPGVTVDTAERQVTAYERARAEAKQRGDARRLDELLAPDFIKINRFGRLLGKRATIALARNPQYDTVDVQLRIYGPGAVVTGRESDEGELRQNVRFLRVWIRDGDQWRELADQGTRISSEPEAARLAKAKPSDVDRTIVEAGSDADYLPDASEARGKVAQNVREAERAYRDAERLNDLATLSRFRAPEFRLVDRLGNVRSSHAAAVPTIKAVQDEDFSVRVHGNLAIVIGSVLRTNLRNSATDRFRYSVVWVRRDGPWRVVAEQRTPIL